MAKGYPKNPNTKVQGDNIQRSDPPVKVKTGSDLRSGK